MPTIRTILVLLALGATGCGSSDACTLDPASCVDGGLGTCAGQCAPGGIGVGFSLLMYVGPAGTAPPACPSFAPDVLDGFLNTPPTKVTCSPCNCSPSANTCSPPSRMTASMSTCPADGGLPFDAPDVWDGNCSTMDPVASADSLTLDPPLLGSGGVCMPSMPTVMSVEGGPAQVARLCSGTGGHPDGTCANPDNFCAYPNEPGFAVCIPFLGPIASCPAGWSVSSTFYAAACNCQCGPPTGEVCSSTVTAYSDSACSQSAGMVTLTSSDQATCFDITHDSALGSKSATVAYTPGNCMSTLTPLGSETLCCLPSQADADAGGG